MADERILRNGIPRLASSPSQITHNGVSDLEQGCRTPTRCLKLHTGPFNFGSPIRGNADPVHSAGWSASGVVRGRPSGTKRSAGRSSPSGSATSVTLLTRMSLPPELIYRVLNSLRDDPQSLLATSLVSKAWASWSQAYLFESVHLTPANLQRWLENISPDADGPASHTRALTLEEYRLLPWINSQNLDFPLSNLASFHDVRSLTLVHWNATLFNGAPTKPYFGHFGKSLRALSLRFCTLDPITLFDLFSLLPNVQDLEIAYLFPWSSIPGTMPDVPKATPSFCGTLTLGDLDSGHPILKAIAVLPLRFTAISIRSCTFYDSNACQMLLTSCRDTLVSLRFEGTYRGVLEACPGATKPVLTFLHL